MRCRRSSSAAVEVPPVPIPPEEVPWVREDTKEADSPADRCPSVLGCTTPPPAAHRDVASSSSSTTSSSSSSSSRAHRRHHRRDRVEGTSRSAADFCFVFRQPSSSSSSSRRRAQVVGRGGCCPLHGGPWGELPPQLDEWTAFFSRVFSGSFSSSLCVRVVCVSGNARSVGEVLAS